MNEPFFPWDTTYVAVSGVSAVLGVILSAVVSFVVNLFSAKRQADIDEITKMLLAADEARKQAFDQLKSHADGLQKQIFDMRSQITEVQHHHLLCTKENGELRSRIDLLTRENDELKRLVNALRVELENMKAKPCG